MSINLFNLGTAKNTNLKVEEGVHFKILKDGHGTDHRIMNFENEEFCPREGIIELEPLRISNRHRHQNNVSFRVIRDKEYDFLVGIPTGIDPKTKNIIWERINIVEGETLDLSIPKDAMRWAVIKRSHFFVDSPNFQGASKTKYKAIDKEREAIVFEQRRRVKRKATDIADALAGTELEDVALAIGLNPKTMSIKTLWVEVVKFAEDQPEKFMEVINSETRIELAVLNRAINQKVVEQKLQDGVNAFFYGGLILGYNQIEAVEYLKDHANTLSVIDALCKKTEKESVKSMKQPEKKMTAEDAAIKIAKLEKELADKEAALNLVNNAKIETKTMEDLVDVDPEFAELMAEAKQLGIKGCHLVKDKEKLRGKIEDKKKLIKN